MIPVDYREFCESTLSLSTGVERQTYLSLGLLVARGDMAKVTMLELDSGFPHRGRMLTAIGNFLYYAALSGEGAEALHLCRQHNFDVDFVITDSMRLRK